MTGSLAPWQCSYGICRLKKTRKADPGFDAAALQSIDKILGGGISGSTGREGTSSETSGRSVQSSGSVLNGIERIGNAHAKGIMAMEGPAE